MGNAHSSINVTFDRVQPAIYFSGDSISGQVHFIISEPTKQIDEIFISLTGDVGYTTSREVRMQNGQIERKTENHDVRILGHRFMLGRPMKNNASGDGCHQVDSATLPPGQYKYPFCIRLPDELPPTLHPEDYPFVRYQLQVLLEKKWYHINDRHRYPIRVYPRVNLLHISNSQSAVKFGSRGKDITVKGVLPSAGMLPGEQTTLSITIENPNRLSIKHVDVCFIQRYEIEHCRRRLELFRVPVAQIVNTSEQLIEATCPFTIPSGIAPTHRYKSKGNRSVVHTDLHYDLKIDVKAKGLFADFDIQVPLLIGTDSAANSAYDGPGSNGNHPINMAIYDTHDDEAPPPSYESIKSNGASRK